MNLEDTIYYVTRRHCNRAELDGTVSVTPYLPRDYAFVLGGPGEVTHDLLFNSPNWDEVLRYLNTNGLNDVLWHSVMGA